MLKHSNFVYLYSVMTFPFLLLEAEFAIFIRNSNESKLRNRGKKCDAGQKETFSSHILFVRKAFGSAQMM